MTAKVKAENDGTIVALPIDGGARMKRRRAAAQDITPEKQEVFFATLADSCNVSLSARAAGFTANWAYRKRRTDARFRHQWAVAVREGYAKLELELLRRAIEGTPKKVRHKDGSDETIREYSNTLAIALLRRHAETIDSLDGLEDDASQSELRGKILEQLDRLRTREGNAACDYETKNAALAAGANLAAIGNELVQFAGAEAVGPGRFVLSGLRRGVRGSEAAMTGHVAGEAFVLINPDALKVLTFAESQIGLSATVTALGVGNKEEPPTISRMVTA